MAAFQPQSIIIVGGSLAGLMHALTLLSHPSSSSTPRQITILERSPTALLHNQGAGIVAGAETQQFFEQYVQPGREIAISSRLRHYLTREGGIVEGSVEERGQRMTSWDLLYHLLRWRVEGMESEYVPGGADGKWEKGRAEYRNGCIVTGVERVDGESGVKVSWSENGKEEGQSRVVDLVIGADGASSTVRRLLMPEVERKYAGYVAWRGTVPEEELSREAKEAFIENFTFFHTDGIQTLGYLIPGQEGTLDPGHRLFNWVWYCNYEDGGQDLEELMTDVNERRHAITLPVGKMKPDLWEKQKSYAAKVLPPQFAEAVSKTKQPFIQAITDVISPQNAFLDDRVLLVGDAVAGFRPHTAASTTQAAFDALQLGRLLSGEVRKEEYDQLILQFAQRLQRSGVQMGQRSQFGHHPLAG